MAEHIVGSGGFPTLTAALAKAKPGDTVRVLPGTYKESIKIATTGLTLVGEPGAVLDGGYSHEWAKTKGSSWRDLQYKAPPAGSKDMIIVAADGVTLDGLSIRNAPDSGVAAGAVKGLTVRNCRFDHLYGTAIKINGTTGTAKDIVIENNYVNAASVRIFDNSRTYTDPQGVSGAIKAGNARGVVIRGNTVINCFGEGINMDKKLTNFVTEGNLVADCNHKYFYCNSAVDGIVRDNVAVCTGHPAHLWSRGRSPAGFAAVDETARKPHSGNLVWENNLAVNMGIPIQIIPRADGKMTVRNNTFVCGPLTRLFAEVKGGKVEFSDNIIVTQPDASVTGAATITGPNLWTAKPPKGWGHADDVIGDPMFVDPTIPTSAHDPYGIIDDVTATLDLSGFRLRPDSPAIVNGVVVFGETAISDGHLPEEPEPPVEPEPDPNEDIIREVLKRFAALEAHVDGILSAATEASRTIRDLTEFVEEGG